MTWSEPELAHPNEIKEGSWEPASSEVARSPRATATAATGLAVGSIAQEGEAEPPVPEFEPPDVSEARSLLTEPRPAGFGEVLVTDVWFRPPAPEPQEDEEAAPVDRRRQWEVRQELRELRLLREKPLLSYDARTEQYWSQVRDAQQAAESAIVDPYTGLAATFAEADIEGMRAHRVEAQEYGREADSLLQVGRAYVAIGRLKSAQGVFRAAVKADPFHAEAWWHLGVAQLLGRANAPAAKALAQALDQSPGDFRMELALAVAHYHAKDYSSAEEHFRRLVGASGLRASARSLLACSLRMQEKWDEAKIELGFLQDAQPGDWGALAEQCLDCVERGEQRQAGPLRARRRARQMWKSLAAAGAGGVWIAYSLAQNLFKEKVQWATVPLFVLVMVLARSLRGISGKEMAGEFGNAEQGLPCWQTTAWMRPRRSEF